MATRSLRAVRRLLHLSDVVSLGFVLGLLLVAYLGVYLAGGSKTAAPHLFYVPILFGALRFGARGALATAAAAVVLCGPAMPLDVAAGVSQEVSNWGARGVFFLAIGGLAGLVVGTVRRDYEVDLVEWLRSELDERDEVVQEPRLQARVRDVLAQGDFHMVYQPIYSLGDGHLLAVEALARFDAVPYEPPNLWFDAAEQVGLGVDLELSAFEAALEGATGLGPGVVLSVNTSPRALEDPRLPCLLDRHRGPRVMVEITEHAVVDDYRALAASLDRLRAQGVMVAVDDAGAGFASLRHIVRLAPDFIKLDLSLTQGVRHDPIRRALATSLIGFAGETGSLLVAEGIEETADLWSWREMGAHAAQGYLLGRPGPLPAVRPAEMLVGWQQRS